MANQPECVITGCELYCPAEGWWVHGDLWKFSTTYIFNGITCEGHTMLKQHGISVPMWSKVLTIDGPYFERRGVVVVSILNGELNDVAKRYLHLE